MNRYLKGQQVQIQNSITVAGAQTDSGTQTATVRKADGTTVMPAVTHAGLGVYTAVVDTSSGPQGVWQYLFSGVAPAQGAEEGEFWVEDAALS